MCGGKEPHSRCLPLPSLDDSSACHSALLFMGPTSLEDAEVVFDLPRQKKNKGHASSQCKKCP